VEEEMTKNVRPAVAVLALALAGGGCVINVDADAVTVREQKRYTVGSGAEIALTTFDGSIKVQSWERPEVLVEIEKRGPDREEAAALEVTARQNGDRIEIEAPAPRVRREFVGIGNVTGPSVSFVVSLPRNITLTANTRDGSISVENVNGTIDLRSGDGSIRGDGLAGSIKARTEDGSVRLADANGRVSLESGDGSIQAAGRFETLHAETNDGSVVIEADEGTAMKADWDISTGDGSIVFRVPGEFSAEIDATSRDGSVRANLTGLEEVRDDNGRESLRGRLGNGGHLVKLRSGDGSIRVVNR
jgi:hypothetical protein